jgi:hypothetical protein
MLTNLEKLAEELNALMDYDPMAMECTEAVISQVQGEQRIYLQSVDERAVFIIDFDQVLPYDPTGAPGTTSDVFAGAHISLNVEHGGEYPDKAEADKFAEGYLKNGPLLACRCRQGRQDQQQNPRRNQIHRRRAGAARA